MTTASAEVLTGLFSLAFASMITPGPNNLVAMSLSVGGNLRRTMAACGGIVSGTVCLVVVTWFGAASIFEVLPVLRIAIVGMGSAYLIWCGTALVLGAWRDKAEQQLLLPSSFWALAGFQFTNPKAWVLCTAAVSAAQIGDPGLTGLIALSAVFTIASVVSLSIWVSIGRLLTVRRGGTRAPPWLRAVLGLALIATSAMLVVSATGGPPLLEREGISG